jgi:hypothetical protein
MRLSLAVILTTTDPKFNQYEKNYFLFFALCLTAFGFSQSTLYSQDFDAPIQDTKTIGGNSGCVTFLTRSLHCLRSMSAGQLTSIPILRKRTLTLSSLLGCVTRTYQGINNRFLS